MPEDRHLHDREPTARARDSAGAAPDDAAQAHADELRRIVLHKSVRRARARRGGTANVWSWMGMFGLVGWTVAVPTLLGIALGVFLDERVESSVSFTLTFLIVGAAVGVSMAWYWIRRESEGDDRP